MAETPMLMVWSDEDGDYFGEGHIPPAEFKAACLDFDREMGFEDEDGAGEMNLHAVRHVWWRQPDPENDERLLRCEPDHPDALPFTAWYRWRNGPVPTTSPATGAEGGEDGDE